MHERSDGAGNHPLFVGPQDQDAYGAIRRADLRSAGNISLRVEPCAKPTEPGHGSGTDFRCILAYAAGEYERRQTADRGGRCGYLGSKAVDEDVNRKSAAGLARRQQLTHLADPA